jgi:hypothetical protein
MHFASLLRKVRKTTNVVFTIQGPEMMCHVWKRVKMWGFSTLFRIFFNVAELRKKEAEIPPK